MSADVIGPRVGERPGEVAGLDAEPSSDEPVERVDGFEGGGGELVAVCPAALAYVCRMSERGERVGVEAGEDIGRNPCDYGELGDGALCVAEVGGTAISSHASMDSSQSANGTAARSW